MENRDMGEGLHDSGPPKLPDLQTGELSLDEVASYLRELRALETPVDVILKGAPRERPRRTAGPDGLLERLSCGEVVSAQLRYVFQGASWVDTLMRSPNGVRLVRMQS